MDGWGYKDMDESIAPLLLLLPSEISPHGPSGYVYGGNAEWREQVNSTSPACEGEAKTAAGNEVVSDTGLTCGF